MFGDLVFKIIKSVIEYDREPYLEGKYEILIDLGCGEGFFIEKLKQHSKTTIGVDVVIPKLKRAYERGGYDDMIIADINHLPLIEEKINCYTLFDVIEHMPKEEVVNFFTKVSCSIFLTTPKSQGYFSKLVNKFFSKVFFAPLEEHISEWSINELKNYRFHIIKNESKFINKGSITAQRDGFPGLVRAT